MIIDCELGNKYIKWANEQGEIFEVTNNAAFEIMFISNHTYYGPCIIASSM